MELIELKKRYQVMAGKHKLPSFEILNKDFEIEKMENETEYLDRAIRKIMMDKIVNALGFFDMFLSGQQIPRLYSGFLKSMKEEDKKELDEMYLAFADLSMQAMVIELYYDEKKEVALIKEIFKVWNEKKPKFQNLLEKIKSPAKNNNEKKEKSYFG